MSVTAQLELKPNYCIFLANYLGIQFKTQLFPTVTFPTRLDRLARPTVTNANRHQKNMESTTQS